MRKNEETDQDNVGFLGISGPLIRRLWCSLTFVWQIYPKSEDLSIEHPAAGRYSATKFVIFLTIWGKKKARLTRFERATCGFKGPGSVSLTD